MGTSIWLLFSLCIRDGTSSIASRLFVISVANSLSDACAQTKFFGIFEWRNGSIQRLGLYPKFLDMTGQAIKKNGKLLLDASGKFVSEPISIAHTCTILEATSLASL